MIYLFNNQEELIKIINSPSIKVLNQTETLTDEHLLDDRITAEVNALEEDLLQEIEYMAVKKQDADYQYSLYYIISATTEGNNTELYGVTAGFEELDKTIIEDKRPRNVIPRVAIDVALENTNWTAGFVGDVPNNSSHFYYISSLEAIKKICQSWGLEAEFVIEMNGSKIGARYINFYKQLGANEGKRVTYGHNALQIIQEDERTGIYTALIGRGKGELISGENENESGQAGYGRRITFEDVEWSVANGDPLNKPLGQKYLEIPDATATYGVKTPQGNRPKMGVVEFQEEEDPENLLKLTYQHLVETSRPLASFKTTPAYLNAGVGDVVRVVRYDRHLDYATRVFKVVTNRLTNKKVSVQLGDQLTQSAGRQRANLANQIGAIADNRVDQILDYLPSATGKNTNYYGQDEPENPKVNDVWWKPNPEGEDKPDWIMRWTGEVWERLDVTSEAIEQQFEEVEKQAQDLADEIEASEGRATEKADQALADAKAYAEAEDARIKQEVDGAVEIAEQAKQDAVDKANQALADAKAHADAEVQASKEHFDSLIEEVESDVANAQATADSAVEQIDTAVTNAGFTSLDDTLQNMNHITMNAEQDAKQAITDASNAYGLAQTSISEAQTAQANSLIALGKADNALDGVSSLNVRVDDVEGELELKADNTFMTEDGELTTLSNAITLNAHRFSSDMSRIESRVESLAGEVNLVILKNEIESSWLSGGETYPNATEGSQTVNNNTMRELINVTPGEQLALSKKSGTDDMFWRISYYNDSLSYIGRITVSNDQQVITVPVEATKMWVSYPKESEPQIVRGTQFVPYRPNLADQMTTNEMVIFRNEYDEFADRTERRLTAVDSAGGSLDVLNNRITTEAGLVRTDMTALIDTKVDDDEFAEFYQNEYLETAQEVSRKISLSDVLVGGRNLIKNSSFYNGFENWHRSSTIAVVGEESGVPHPFVRINNQSTYNVHVEQNVDVESGTDYVFSYTLHRNGLIILAELDEHDTEVSRVVLDKVGNYSRYSHKLKTSPDTRTLRVVLLAVPTEHPLFYAIQLEKGNVLSDWERAPEDVDTQLNHIESEWTQTFDTFSQTVSGIDGRVTDQKQTIDSISSTVSGHGDRITTVEQTASGLQTTVADKASQSQVTQLSDSLSSVVEYIPTNLVTNPSLESVEGWSIPSSITVGNHTDEGRLLIVNAPGARIYNRGGDFEPGKTYYISFKMHVASGGAEVQVGSDNDSNRPTVSVGEVSGNRSHQLVYKPTVNSSNFSMYFMNTGIYRFQDVFISDAPFTEAMGSQISQLSDNIDLRVSKGDLLSQINIEAERTLIQSNRLVLDADSVLFTGSAFIPSAQIESLHADKINAGTINTARLNATEIVAQGLTADVVTATHIKSDTALIDNIFASQALVDRLWAKSIWTNKISTMSLDASQITAGEIETARLKVTEIVSQGLSGNEDSITQLLIGDDVFQSSVTNLTQQKVADELTQEYETVTREVNLYEQVGNQATSGNGTIRWADFTFDFDLEVGKEYHFSLNYPLNFNSITYQIYTILPDQSQVRLSPKGWIALVENNDYTYGSFEPVMSVPAGQVVRIQFDDNRTSSLIRVQDLTIRVDKEIQVPIVSQDNGVIANRITQTQNAIDLGLFGEEGAITRIYAGEKGLYLKGENIVLDGNVSMEQAFIRNLVASDITANTIASASATFTNLISTNIDAQSITTQTLNALRARIMGAYTYVDISGTGIGINRYDGNRSIELNTNGMDIYRGGDVVAGRVGGANDLANVYAGIVHIGAERQNAVSLSSKQNGTSSNWVRSLWVDGSSGQIKIGAPLMDGETGYGIELRQQTISGEGTGIAIMSKTQTSTGIAFVNGRVWYRTQGHGWRDLDVWATGN